MPQGPMDTLSYVLRDPNEAADELDALREALAAQQDADDRAGMLWWNGLSDDDRKKWVQPSGRAKDAWDLYRRGKEK